MVGGGSPLGPGVQLGSRSDQCERRSPAVERPAAVVRLQPGPALQRPEMTPSGALQAPVGARLAGGRRRSRSPRPIERARTGARTDLGFSAEEGEHWCSTERRRGGLSRTRARAMRRMGPPVHLQARSTGVTTDQLDAAPHRRRRAGRTQGRELRARASLRPAWRGGGRSQLRGRGHGPVLRLEGAGARRPLRRVVRARRHTRLDEALQRSRSDVASGPESLGRRVLERAKARNWPPPAFRACALPLSPR